MSDKVREITSISQVSLVALHGYASEPDSGFIFSNEEYTRSVNLGMHAWYQQLVDDYRAHLPLFVGSSLNEPILAAEIDRASQVRGPGGGVAFLLTPDELTPIRQQALAARHIRHIRGGIEDLIHLLAVELGPNWPPSEVLGEITPFDDDALASVTKKELAAAQFLKPVQFQRSATSFSAKSHAQKAVAARNFLMGFPSSWEIAASDVPIKLSGASGLRSEMRAALESQAGLFVVTGPAGSGKSTAAMQAVLDIQREGLAEAYELDIEAPSIIDVISVISKVSPKKKIVFIPVLYVVAGVLSDNLSLARSRGGAICYHGTHF